MVLRNDTVDPVFKVKTSKGIILLKFRCCYDSCSANFLTMFEICTKSHENTLNGLKSHGVNTISKIADGVLALILCIPSDVASYLFKDYKKFFDSSKFYN